MTLRDLPAFPTRRSSDLDTGAGTITDAADQPTVTISDAVAAEGSPLVFTVSIDHVSVGNIVLDLAASSGTATAGADFETGNFRYSTDGGSNWVSAGGVNGTQVTIASGSTSILVEVDTNNDATY